MHTVQKVLKHVFDELMDKGLHPNSEVSVDNVCKRFRDTLLLRAIARSPKSNFKSTIGAVICVVGEDLIITTNGIENSKMEESETIPHYAVFNKAGIELRQSEGDDDDFGLGDDYYFDKSGFADHPDLNSAISIIGQLYKSRYLSGLYDHRLKYS